ncbi:hypothetical protein ABW20_dc0109652 [Dactylellina cionopaga]|nr:hypothetical protein ABW20_dc0109652 [Dactylellina cionopaga]
MPRVTRSQAAVLQEPVAVDSTKLQQREPFEEVNANIKPIASQRTTRARSKAGTRKENYDLEQQTTVIVVDDEDTKSSSATSVVSSKSSRSVRGRPKKHTQAVVQDEVQIETYEVIIKRSTRSTRRGQQELESTEDVAEVSNKKTQLVEEGQKVESPSTQAASKPITRTARARQNIPDANTTVRRTRRQAAAAGESEQPSEYINFSRSPIRTTRGRPAIKTTITPLKTPEAKSETPKRLTPVASPVRARTVATQSKIASPNTGSSASGRVYRSLSISPARPVSTPAILRPSPTTPKRSTGPLNRSTAKSNPKAITEDSSTEKAPARPVATITPVSKRITAAEKQLKVTTPPTSVSKRVPALGTPNVSPTVTLDVKKIQKTLAATPIRPAVPVSLATIKRTQTKTDARLVAATPSRNIHLTRDTASPRKIETPVFNKILSQMPTPTPKAAKGIAALASPAVKVLVTPTLSKAKPYLGSPYASPATVKATPRIPSIKVPLGSFASPTKSHLARQSLALASRHASGDQEAGSSNGTSMIVNISKSGPSENPPQPSSNPSFNKSAATKAVVLPPVLRKKAPEVATTRAVLLRARKASGQSVGDRTAAPVTQKLEKLKLVAPVEAAAVPEPVKTAVPPKPKIIPQNPMPVIQIVKKATLPRTKPIIKTRPESISVSTVRLPARSTPKVAATTATLLDSEKEATKPVKPQQVTIPTISISKPEPEVSIQAKISTGPIVSKASITTTKKPVAPIIAPIIAPLINPIITPSIAPSKVTDEAKTQIKEPVKTTAVKLVTQKKVFQPVKSSKPLTIPVSFQCNSGSQTGMQPAAPKAPATISSIKDRIQKFEAPKSKPKPSFVDARTLLREARKEARKGTLPKITGEVEYASLLEVEPEPPAQISKSSPAPAPAPILTPIVPPTGSTPQAVQPAMTRPVSPAKSIPTHGAVVISGLQKAASPERAAFLDDLESMKRAKERAEASVRGHRAVM